MPDKAGQIIAAARDLFIARRYHEVTLDEVARRAGVGKGTIYRYFEDKEDLYLKTLLAGLDELVACLSEMSREGQADLLSLARRNLEFAKQHRPLFGLLHSEEVRTSPRARQMRSLLHQRGRAIRDVFADAIRAGVEAGTYRQDVDPDLTAAFLQGMLRIGVRRAEADSPALVAEKAVGILERGIANRTE